MEKKKLFILLIFDLIYGAGWLVGRFLVKKYVFTGDVTDMVKATQTNVGKVLQVTSGLYKCDYQYFGASQSPRSKADRYCTNTTTSTECTGSTQCSSLRECATQIREIR